jgi:hypothetical protein
LSFVQSNYNFFFISVDPTFLIFCYHSDELYQSLTNSIEEEDLPSVYQKGTAVVKEEQQK